MEEKTGKKTITEDVIRYVAGLSRLHFEDKDVAMFQEQLSQIIGYIEQLEEVDTENTEPTTHVLSSMKNVFRDDIPKSSISPDKATLNAPEKKENFFQVPRVIKDT